MKVENLDIVKEYPKMSVKERKEKMKKFPEHVKRSIRMLSLHLSVSVSLSLTHRYIHTYGTLKHSRFQSFLCAFSHARVNMSVGDSVCVSVIVRFYPLLILLYSLH